MKERTALRRVVISGMGVVSPFGLGSASFWKGIADGRTGARMIDTFDTEYIPTKFAAPVPVNDASLDEAVENKRALRTLSRSGKYALIAAQEAAAQSGLLERPPNPARLGTSFGASGLGIWDVDHARRMTEITVQSACEVEDKANVDGIISKNVLEQVHPLSPLKALSNIPTAHVAITYNARGPSQTITTACTSSSQAIGDALRQIRWGLADAIIAGGSDSMVNPNGLIAFSMLGVLSKNNDEFATACRPFDKRRDGFMIGDGAAMFVLEELEHCLARGATPIAELAGYANTSDAYRLTDEPAEAWGSIAAIKGAIEDAGVAISEVDYVNAHGTGTRMNDVTESFAIASVLTHGGKTPPVSSTKSMVGHLVAAAGAIEFAACVCAIQHQTIPPTINFREPDAECPLDYVPNVARRTSLNVVLSNSFGFGGQNACLVLRNMDRRSP